MNSLERVTCFESLKRRFHAYQAPENAVETLTAFVRDTEHEILSVVTTLQAHIDLLHTEQLRYNLPLDRFTYINQSMDRLVADTISLGSVSELTKSPRSKQKQSLEHLVRDITEETRATFERNNVSLSCSIVKGTTLTGNANALKLIIKEVVLAVLQKCRQYETVRITGSSLKKKVSLLCDRGSEANENEFSPWQLGKLHLLPTNGEGIKLSAVDAMARMNRGHLSVRSSLDNRPVYRLSFQN